MALIALVGLGNPGAEYALTRHNAGFWFLDRVAERCGVVLRTEARFQGEAARARWGDQELVLLKPATFMNRSGQAVQALCQFYKLTPAEVLVAHDELDLPPGVARLKLGGGHGGHNGLRDIHARIGAEYRRLRLGIGHPGHKDRVLGYVLGRAEAEAERALNTAIDAALEALEVWFTRGWELALTRLHSPSPSARA